MNTHTRPNTLRVQEALDPKEPRTVAQIAEHANLDMLHTQAELGLLELDGRATSRIEGWLAIRPTTDTAPALAEALQQATTDIAAQAAADGDSNDTEIVAAHELRHSATAFAALVTPLAPALETFAEAFSEGVLISTLAPQLTCVETDALTGLLRAISAQGAADDWLSYHAAEDEEGDVHYRA